MKYAKYLFFFIFIVVAQCLYAQDTDEKYELLRTELQLYGAYTPLPKTVSSLMDSAARYAKTGDYGFALVFLEQARDDLPTVFVKKTSKITIPSPTAFTYYVQSGVDFNRQEFELGFDQSDSSLLEQVNKPYVGFGLRVNGFDGNLTLENQMRYDKENLENELSLRNRWQGRLWAVDGLSGYIFDNNFRDFSLGYHELYSSWSVSYYGAVTRFSLREDARYKRYFEPSDEIPDYFRNSLSSYFGYQFNYTNTLRLSYLFDYNQSMQTKNNDYSQNSAVLEYRGFWYNHFSLIIPLGGGNKQFSYIINDSLLNNSAVTLSLNPDIEYRATGFLSLGIKYKIDKKKYNIKTEQDPDYMYTQIAPRMTFIFSDALRMEFGYLFEKKNHLLQPGLEAIYIREQNYQARGLSFNLDFTQLSGLLLTLDIRYAKRRYPEAIVADNFSIYSNRNIFSVLTFAQWPISDNLSLNLIAAYDNDKDLDSDFNDSRSSFYTVDLKYEF